MQHAKPGLEFISGTAVQPTVNDRIYYPPAEPTRVNSAAKKEAPNNARQDNVTDLPGGRPASRRAGPRRLFTLASNSSPTVSPTKVTSAFGRRPGWMRHRL